MANVTLKNINKIYDNNVQAVFDFNLDVKDGEFIVLVGPSGCGKSTTLRMIAGLEDISSGELYIDGTYSNDLLAKDRDTAMVFQNYALYPHMSVYENMAFGLKNRKVDKKEIDRRVREAAEILGISEYLKRKPKALSGGQCQRVALGRAIVRQAKAFLMDEPLSNLDAKLRVQMRAEIIKLHKKIGAITIYVTHDQTEAMTMADRIVVMSKGFIQQIGTPREIYNHPKNLFVASFIGTPQMNFLNVKKENNNILLDNDAICLSDSQLNAVDTFYKNEINVLNEKLSFLDSRFTERNDVLQRIESLSADEENNKEELNNLRGYLKYLEDNHPDRVKLIEKIEFIKNVDTNNVDSLILGVRPEDIDVSFNKKKDYLRGKVSVVELLGHNQIVHVDINGQEVLVEVSAKQMIDIDQEVYVKFDYEYLHLFDKCSEDAIF